MAIKCFVPDCTEDVVGQCPGLPAEPCGHFCCTIHSRGKLCDECAAIQERQNLYNEYLKTAEWADGRDGTRSGYILLILVLSVVSIILPFAIFFPLSNSIGNSLSGILAWVFVFVFLIGSGLFMNIKLNKKLKARQKEAFQKYDHFEQFFKDYKAKKDKEVLVTVGLITAGLVVGAVASAFSSEAATQRDVRRIRDRLDRM